MSVVLRLNAQSSPVLPGEREVLSSLDAELVEIEGAEDGDILRYADTADALMVVAGYVRGSVIERLSKCRLISRIGTGVDKIDVDAATGKGIIVTNVADFCTDEVADHTMALLLSVARKLKFYENQIRRGRQLELSEPCDRLSLRTLGIVGLGHIGRAVAKRALGFGMRVIGFDPGISAEEMLSSGVAKTDMDTVLAESDYLSLSCPLNDATRGMLSIRELRKMKPSAVLVNAGRGELVVEEDLVAALREGIIRFAALDVFSGINVFATGGFSTDHPLFGLENVVMTPHMAAYSTEAFLDSRVRAAQAVVDVLSGRWPKDPVNPGVVPWFEIARP